MAVRRSQYICCLNLQYIQTALVLTQIWSAIKTYKLLLFLMILTVGNGGTAVGIRREPNWKYTKIYNFQKNHTVWQYKDSWTSYTLRNLKKPTHLHSSTKYLGLFIVIIQHFSITLYIPIAVNLASN